MGTTYSYKRNKDGKLVSTYHPEKDVETAVQDVDEFLSSLNETCARIFTQGMDPELKSIIVQDFLGE